MNLPFRDRIDAGRRLADALRPYRGRDDLVVLALPRGGVPVAAEVAQALGGELDLMVVRKLGTPGQEELALGAIATGGARVLNADVVSGLHIGDVELQAVEQRERTELQRRQALYRGDRPEPRLAGRCVILVDDGLATGATMRAAAQAARSRDPSRLVIAIPVAPRETVAALAAEADEVVCLETPAPFVGVGRWYARFDQVSDPEVTECLARAWSRTEA